MKRIAVFMFILGITGISLNAVLAQTRKEKKQEKRDKEFAAIDSLIESKTYRFDARKANPSGGQQVDLTTHSADLIINNDSVESYLPFFGRAYNIAYRTSDSGIKFETLHSDYTLKKDTVKRTIDVSFSAKTEYDDYEFNLSVTSGGSATLGVISINRAFISFNGTIEPLKKK